MRASIIIAAHQEGALLAKTVESCLRHASDLEREIIVADDASTDGSVDEVAARSPELRIVRNEQRLGVSPTKDLGARRATGDVLVFLDAHTNPEPGAILRLVEDVERLEGAAAVTPAIASLCHRTWRNLTSRTGHGYSLELETFKSGWLALDKLRKVERAERTFYESPALIGCAFAVARELYDRLWGFDTAMRLWGVEDLDFSLKCWLMGSPILHDPAAVIGHRFQESFSSYRVSAVEILVSQMRMAYKNLSLSTWPEWLRMCRERCADLVSGWVLDNIQPGVNIPVSYPTDDTLGNDDYRTDDEDDDPYNGPYPGKLQGADIPAWGMRNTTGVDGDTFEQRLHAQEFARLELLGSWFRISDFVLWRFHEKFEHVNGAWVNNGSDSAWDNAGW